MENEIAPPASRPAAFRRLELALILLAGVVVAGALALTDANLGRGLSTAPLELAGGFLCLFLMAHVAVRLLAPHADPLFLPCIALLNGLGIVLISRIDASVADRAARLGQPIPAGDAPKQLAFTAASVLIFVLILAWVRAPRQLRRYGFVCGLLGLGMVLLPVLLPSALSEVNGAKRWVKLGPVFLQPAELGKVAVLVFVATFLALKRQLLLTVGRRVMGMTFPRARDLAPVLWVWAVCIGVAALGKDLGTALLFFGTVLAMLYVATERVRWVVVALGVFVLCCVVAYHVFAHVQVRVEAWSDPFAHYDGAGYQIGQGLFGMGTGGVLGTGLGLGRPDLVPFARTDFVTAALGEELGLAGLTAVLLLYLVLVTRGLRAAIVSRDDFTTLLVTGLAFSLGFQVFVVVGGVTTLIPLTGMPMPFLSYGGSSLMASYLVAALLVRASDNAHRPAPERPPQRAPLQEAATHLMHRPSRSARWRTVGDQPGSTTGSRHVHSHTPTPR
ncbi:cell division protein FtsW [Longimycelium tulufanense]|uniref:peptidoglycan glycosyltransferase n=1 Tax=Longimycelium tulufanense TaxID=907463 RepID=A0A8J3CF75_9PSEU|nr:FtsW/RodA/SpoVE family cell cycle protein [Longimycelium tulufanense]GGM56774.1 cell division protein FtsW [Longimycelium tulufanense]